MSVWYVVKGTPASRSLPKMVGVRALVGQRRWLHVVEEPTPLVVGEDEQAALPVLRLLERLEHLPDEALPEEDVALRVVVGAEVAAERR